MSKLWKMGAPAFLLLLTAVGVLFYRRNAENQKQYQETLQIALSRGLKEDNSGRAPLRSGFHSLSLDGNVYVTRRNGLVLVYFPQKIGGHGDSNGILIASHPLRELDMTNNEDGQSGILTNMPENPARTPDPTHSVSLRVTLILRQFNRNEYDIYYNDD